MIIKMQKCLSENEKLEKTIVDVAEFSGILRSGTSIIDPVILVDGNVSTYADCNYCYIPEFDRYYFIKNITQSKTMGLFEISCHVDVLYTYRNQIRSQKAVVARNRNLYNMYLNDGQFRTYQNSITKVLAFPNSFSRSDNCYILVTNGSGHVVN